MRPGREASTRRGATASGFTSRWAEARPSVARFCRVHTDNQADADDLEQTVALRVWLGERSFRGDSSYLTWVMRIAEREAARFGTANSRRSRQEDRRDPFSLGLDDEREAISPAGYAPDQATLARAIMDEALGAGAISKGEVAVLRLRIERPDATWQEVGHALGRTSTDCAVAHCRAIPKLRVFVFLHRMDVLGGEGAVRAAYQAAICAPDQQMSAEEQQAFDYVVLRRRGDYRKRGWQGHLRSACAKVADHLQSDLFQG